MSKSNQWIALDKYLTQEFKSINREFSMIEAMFSYSVDVDNGVEISISGYSKIWGWSRNKVRRFLKGIRTGRGHLRDRKRTAQGHPIHFIDSSLWSKEDSKRTGRGQVEDTCETPSLDPNPNPDKKKNIPHQNAENVYISKKGKTLKNKRLNSFNLFWDDFNYKKDKASAADAWMNIPLLTDKLVKKICAAAKTEAENREKTISKGLTPIYAQGWLTGKRWEDEFGTELSGEEIRKQHGF